MVKPLVSILIPAFNAEEWIAETIRSAIAHRWRDSGNRDPSE
jgi:glycosyltransferase involved in cell wall biosynthesis